MFKPGKPNYLKKKKKNPICSCLQKHLSYQGNPSKSSNHQQSPNSLSIHLQLSHTFYADILLPSKPPDRLFPSLASSTCSLA